MQEKDFDLLIDKYLNDQLNEAEKKNFDLWVRQITDHHAADSISDLEKKERGVRLLESIAAQISNPAAKAKPALKVRLQPLFRIAASLFLCCFLLFALRSPLKNLFNIQQYVAATNASGQITKTMLPDGSIVWLKGNSKLIYPLPFRGNLRIVKLEGEALFEIAKDPAHPFVIHCGGLSTRVLGTSFNIRYASHKIEVNVLTGRVFLSSARSRAIILHPYQKAVYSVLKKTIIKQNEPVIEVASLIRGTEYNMLFKDARVGEVLQRIENKFDVHINVESSKLTSNRITADFTDQSLLNTINILSEAFNLSFRRDGNTIILTDKQNLPAKPNQKTNEKPMIK